MIWRFLTAKLHRRLILLMLLATIPAMLAGFWILSQAATDRLRAAAEERLRATTDDVAQKVDVWLGSVARDLALLSRHPDLASLDPARQRALLFELHKVYPTLAYAHTIGPDGMNVARMDDNPLTDYHDRQYFQRVMAGAGLARETIPTARSTGHPSVNQAAPILAPNGKILGVIVVGMNLSDLSEVVGAARYGHTGYSFVVDEQGRALAHPDLKYADALKDLRSLAPVQGVIGKRASRSYRFQDEAGISWLAYAVPLSNGWSTVSLQQEAEVLADVHDVFTLALLVTEITALVMIALVWLVTRRMIRPIVGMTQAANEIACGDWTRRMPEDRSDELGTLAKAFNKMVGELQSLYRSVREKVDQLSTSMVEQKKSAEALRVAEAKSRSILDAIPGVVFHLDADKTIVDLRASGSDSELNSADRMLGKRIQDVFPCDVVERFLSGVARAASTGTVQTIEYCLVGRNEKGRDYEAQIAPMGTAGWLVLARDISDRKLLQFQLAQAQKLESIGQLAAGVAHEINTPIQYVGDNTRFLQDSFASVSQLLSDYGELLGAAHSDSLSPERLAAAEAKFHQSEVPYLIDEIPSAIGQSLEGIDRVATIVRAMKSFSHPDGDQKELTDLNHCIENTVLVARNEWKYVAEMVTDFDPQLPLVSCLPGEFNQVVLNLIVNAAHAIADAPARDPNQKGTIRISTRRIDDWVEIQVGDNGSGIPQAVRGRVFDPFFTTKEVGRGTGQGLAIAYAVIVEKHGGTITFETELGRGTTFIVRLPVGEPPAEQPLHEMEASLA
jgi:signal transduction histidine kinase